MPKGLYIIISFLSIRHAHGDLCKHLGKDSSTNLDDRYSNLFLNAYINRHAHTLCCLCQTLIKLILLKLLTLSPDIKMTYLI